MTLASFEGKEDIYPIGSIIAFTGSLSMVPEGWIFCDGNNGTPDLHDKFLKSVPDTSTDPSIVGGSNSKAISQSQMPSHSHPLSIESAGDHSHNLELTDDQDLDINSGYEDYDPDYKTTETITWNHGHSISTNSTGGDGSFDNQPPFYEVAFIKKISE